MKILKRFLVIIIIIPSLVLGIFCFLIPIFPAIFWAIFGGNFDDWHIAPLIFATSLQDWANK